MDVAHLHYDLSGPREDRNCVFPIDRAAELHAEGHIGSLADTYYSFMGFIMRPDLLASETAPEAARLLKADGVDAGCHHRYLTHLQSVQWTDSARPGGGGHLNRPRDDEQRPSPR